MVVYISLEVTEGVIRVAEIVKEIFFICFSPHFQKEAWGMDLFTTITLRFPNEGLREICLFPFHKFCLHIHVNNRRFERNSSQDYYHMAYIGKKISRKSSSSQVFQLVTSMFFFSMFVNFDQTEESIISSNHYRYRYYCYC